MHVTIRSTSHAQSRQARRNLSDQDVRFVFEHGRRMRCAGALHVFLGRRDIPADKKIHSRYAHLEGTMLVMDDTQGEVVLITAYRNRRGLRRLRAKAKYDCCDGQARPRHQVWDDRLHNEQS